MCTPLLYVHEGLEVMLFPAISLSNTSAAISANRQMIAWKIFTTLRLTFGRSILTLSKST